MKAVKFKELLCVLVLIVFVVFLSRETVLSDKTAQEIFDSVSSFVDLTELSKCDKAKFKKETGFETGAFEDVLFYASDNIMQVREIIIVKLKNREQSQDLVTALEKRVSEKANLFEGYAPEQSAMLQSFVLEERGGFVFFAVCERPELTVSAFRRSL